MSDVKTDTATTGEHDQLSLVEVILKGRNYIRYLLKNWLFIGLIVGLGAALGGLYSLKSKPIYVAQSTFALDHGDNKLPGMGLASIALGGNKSADLFNETENIIWLYSTRLMIERTLLTQVDSLKKPKLLINWFIEESKLQKKIDKDPKLKNVRFKAGLTDSTLSLEQSSVMGTCVDMIRNKYLSISETKKTQNIITVSMASSNELFSKAFTETLVDNVNHYYIATKTEKASREVKILQQKADSFRSQMDVSMYQATRAIDAVPNANPMQQVLRVEPQRKQIDVQISSAIYTEIMKNLETSKFTLAKATPIIQVIEAPALPLSVVKPPLIKSTGLGIFLGFFIACIALEIKRLSAKIKQAIRASV